MYIFACALAQFLGFVAYAMTPEDSNACMDRDHDVAVIACSLLIAYRSTTEEDRYMALTIRGTHHLAMGRYDTAIADFTDAITLAPRHLAAYSSRAEVYQKLRLYDKAVADIDHVLSLDPKRQRLYLQRADMYAIMGDYVAARKDYLAAIDLDRWSAEGAYASAKLVVMLMHLKDAEGLVSFYSAEIKAEPKNALVYAARAASYLRQNKVREALKDFDAAIAIDPTAIDALLGRIMINESLGNFALVFADYERILRIDPQSIATLRERAKLYEKLEDYEHASADYQRILKIQPDNAVAHIHNGRLRAIQ